MLNQCILVGKVLEINTSGDSSNVVISIARNYKEHGEDEYRTDEIAIVLTEHLQKTALEYLKVDATVGVKARIKSSEKMIANTPVKLHEIVAEKLTFINSRQE